mmetsp:Transcript_32051/g.76482  ORF Transcript_32051/g.76482 Transcript_32051/m.76482 type:complete len:481 (-) Transcript_32051:164-1606(-)
MTYEVRVMSMASNSLCAVAAESEWQGRDLKDAISTSTKVPVRKMKLLFGTTLIRATDKLANIFGESMEVEVLLVRQEVDFDYWLDEISRDYRRLRKAPEEIRADQQVVLAAIEQDAEAIKFASESIKANRECALEALKKNWRLYSFLDLNLWEDRDVVMLFVPHVPSVYAKLSSEMKSDRGLVEAVLRTDGWALRSAPCNFQADRDLVLLAARSATPTQRPWNNFLSITRTFAADKEVVMACVATGGCTISQVDEALQKDPEVLKALIRGHPRELANAPGFIQEDREFVLQMLGIDGMVLEFAGKFVDDAECVAAAIQNSPRAIKFASLRLRGDKTLAEMALSSRPANRWADPGSPLLSYMSKELRGDRAVVLAAVSNTWEALEFADAQFLKDREVVLAAVSQSGMALELVANVAVEMEDESKGAKKKSRVKKARNSLLEDMEVLTTAVSRNRGALHWCPKHLQEAVEAQVKAKQPRARR